MKAITVRLTFIEEVLGTSSGNPDLHREFIASKAPDAIKREEEVAAIGVDAEVEKSMTVFPKSANGTPFFWDYQIKGFFKDTCSALSRCKGEDIAKESCKLKAYKKIIDGNVFVWPRCIPIDMKGGLMDSCQRPLRASTAQGERIALANSESVPEGSEISFSVLVLQDGLHDAVIEWLNYGLLRGIGQWRNSGKGRFVYEIVEDRDATMKDYRDAIVAPAQLYGAAWAL